MAWDLGEKLSEIGLDSVQQARVLEWYARRVWVIQEESSSYGPEYVGKSYDPLAIEMHSDGTIEAHSYVLEFSGHLGGRHYEFESLDELERCMTKGLIEGIVADREQHVLEMEGDTR